MPFYIDQDNLYSLASLLSFALAITSSCSSLFKDSLQWKCSVSPRLASSREALEDILSFKIRCLFRTRAFESGIVLDIKTECFLSHVALDPPLQCTVLAGQAQMVS
jgi:hypothetical protein